MPPEIVVGIVGVESIYGRQMGDFRVIDALATLAFDFPTGRKDRSAFFRDELENWFVLLQERRHRPARLARAATPARSAWRSSCRRASTSTRSTSTATATSTCTRSAADVIGSVAHYLAEFGWKRGLPARFDVRPPTDDAAERAALLAPDIVPTLHRRARCASAAPGCAEPARASTACWRWSSCRTATRAPSYVAGTTNFYALTRYNWSSYYAMAVIELGEAVRPRRALSAQEVLDPAVDAVVVATSFRAPAGRGRSSQLESNQPGPARAAAGVRPGVGVDRQQRRAVRRWRATWATSRCDARQCLGRRRSGAIPPTRGRCRRPRRGAPLQRGRPLASAE